MMKNNINEINGDDTPVDENQSAEEPTGNDSLAEEQEKAQKYLTSWQRTQADFTNYKKRM